MIRQHHRTIALLIFAVFCVVGWWAYGEAVRWERLLQYESVLRGHIERHLLFSVLVGLAIYVVTSLIPGTTGKSILYGWLFGFWIALPIVCLSLTAAAMIGFLGVRYLFRDWAVARASNWIARMDRALQLGGPATCLLTMRVLHAPYSLTNYAAGTTSIPLRTFTWTTAVGMFPSNVVFVLSGSQLPTLEEMGELSVWELVHWPLLISFSLLALLPGVTKGLASKIFTDGQTPLWRRIRKAG